MASNAISSRVGTASEVVWLDYPDYENVGDSAIWLGQSAWARARGVDAIFSVPQRAITPLLMRRIPQSAVGVINGGGNFGGLWANHHAARIQALKSSKGRRLVQAPQSIHLPSARHLDELVTAAHDVDFQVLVRDEESQNAVRSIFDTALSPDAAHILGALEAPAPVTATTWLLRRDKEQVGHIATLNVDAAIDWPREQSLPRRIRKLKYEIVGRLGLTSTLSKMHWQDMATLRLARGLEVLSRGEVVVTDRLHAMILALQLGRKVIAIDNRVQKLSRYANTWFNFGAPWLYWAEDIEAAVAMRRSL